MPTLAGTIALAIASLMLASNQVDAKGKRCALASPSYTVSGGVGVFRVTIDCKTGAPNAKAFPVGEEVLVGLTLYPDAEAPGLMGQEADFEVKRELDAAPQIAAALKRTTSSKSLEVAGGPKWIVLRDEDWDKFDLPVKFVLIDAVTSEATATFTAELSAFKDMRYMLFAAWTKAKRESCDRDDLDARPGCKNEGYVLGDASGVSPLASYPGMEINRLKHATGDWVAERWIAERFR